MNDNENSININGRLFQIIKYLVSVVKFVVPVIILFLFIGIPIQLLINNIAGKFYYPSLSGALMGLFFSGIVGLFFWLIIDNPKSFIKKSTHTKILSWLNTEYTEKEIYCFINFFFSHNLYQNLEHIMDKFLTIAKFILGGIFVVQIMRCLYTLYLITSTFTEIKANPISPTINENTLSAYGWVMVIQIFWALVWLILFFVVKHFNKNRITIDDILDHAND